MGLWRRESAAKLGDVAGIRGSSAAIGIVHGPNFRSGAGVSVLEAPSAAM
jgi:hypothetical protein